MGLDIWRNPRIGHILLEEMDREFAEAEHMLRSMFRIVRDIAPNARYFRRLSVLLWLSGNNRS